MDFALEGTSQQLQNNCTYDSAHIMINNNKSKKQPLNIISNYMTQNNTQPIKRYVNYTNNDENNDPFSPKTLKNTSTFVKISSLSTSKNIDFDELKLKILNIQRSYMTNKVTKNKDKEQLMYDFQLLVSGALKTSDYQQLSHFIIWLFRLHFEQFIAKTCEILVDMCKTPNTSMIEIAKICLSPNTGIFTLAQNKTRFKRFTVGPLECLKAIVSHVNFPYLVKNLIIAAQIYGKNKEWTVIILKLLRYYFYYNKESQTMVDYHQLLITFLLNLFLNRSTQYIHMECERLYYVLDKKVPNLAGDIRVQMGIQNIAIPKKRIPSLISIADVTMAQSTFLQESNNSLMTMLLNDERSANDINTNYAIINNCSVHEEDTELIQGFANIFDCPKSGNTGINVDKKFNNIDMKMDNVDQLSMVQSLQSKINVDQEIKSNSSANCVQNISPMNDWKCNKSSLVKNGEEYHSNVSPIIHYPLSYSTTAADVTCVHSPMGIIGKSISIENFEKLDNFYQKQKLGKNNFGGNFKQQIVFEDKQCTMDNNFVYNGMDMDVNTNMVHGQSISWKKNIIWIIITVAVVLAIGLWTIMKYNVINDGFNNEFDFVAHEEMRYFPVQSHINEQNIEIEIEVESEMEEVLETKMESVFEMNGENVDDILITDDVEKDENEMENGRENTVDIELHVDNEMIVDDEQTDDSFIHQAFNGNIVGDDMFDIIQIEIQNENIINADEEGNIVEIIEDIKNEESDEGKETVLPTKTQDMMKNEFDFRRMFQSKEEKVVVFTAYGLAFAVILAIFYWIRFPV